MPDLEHEQDGQELGGQELGGQEHEGAEHEGAEHEGAEHEGAEHEGAEHEGAEHEGAEHEGAEHEGAGAARSRGETRMQRLANERAEAKARAEMAEREAEWLRKQLEARNRQPQPAEQDQFLDPDEKWRRDSEQRINQMAAQVQDTADKAAYTARTATSAMHARYEQRVELELKKARANGQNPSREGLLAYLIGQDAIENQGRKTPAARQATARVAAARGNPVAAKPNVAAPRGEQSLAERLRDIPL